jgi:hypothetical protein
VQFTGIEKLGYKWLYKWNANNYHKTGSSGVTDTLMVQKCSAVSHYVGRFYAECRSVVSDIKAKIQAN